MITSNSHWPALEHNRKVIIKFQHLHTESKIPWKRAHASVNSYVSNQGLGMNWIPCLWTLLSFPVDFLAPNQLGRLESVHPKQILVTMLTELNFCDTMVKWLAFKTCEEQGSGFQFWYRCDRPTRHILEHLCLGTRAPHRSRSIN